MLAILVRSVIVDKLIDITIFPTRVYVIKIGIFLSREFVSSVASGNERFTTDLFKKALSDFSNITQLKEEQKRCLRSLAERKDVFCILPTGFGKSLIFQMLPHVIKVTWKLE